MVDSPSSELMFLGAAVTIEKAHPTNAFNLTAGVVTLWLEAA